MEIDKDKLKEFLLSVREKTKVSSVELIEKDFYLNVLLSRLNLREYAFKGGTCLAKVYLDHFRFSEDLDFTFINQKLFENKSTKSIKKICKEKINDFGKQLENMGFDFIFDKSDKKYVEIGNNNKLVTFKLWYESLFTGYSSFIKIQINFLETIKFNIKTLETSSLIKDNLSKEDKIYYQEFLDYYKKRKIPVYDIKEIFIEKFRSLLTRKAIKSRDAIDLFFINKRFRIKTEDFLKEINEKITFAIENYEKYKDNFIFAKEKLDDTPFSHEEIRHLVIKDFKKEDFEDFVKKLRTFLQKVILSIK